MTDDDRHQAFANVVAGQHDFCVFGQARTLGIVVDRAGDRTAKSRQMRSAVDRVDVVRERKDLFVVAVVVLHRHLDRKVVSDHLEIERLVVQRALVLVEVLDEFGDAAFVVKLVRLFGFFALVLDENANALVEKRLFAKTL